MSRFCQLCPGGRCGPEVTDTVGPSGGQVCGPDGTCLILPVGALLADELIGVRRPEPQPDVAGEVVVSRVYEIRSLLNGYVALSRPGRVRIALSTAGTDPVAIAEIVGGLAVERPATVANGVAEAMVDRLGTFVAVRAASTPDAGTQDASAQDASAQDAP